MGIWVICSIIVSILGALATGFIIFKVDVKYRLLREEGGLTAGQKILDKIASIYLFSLLLIITLGSWFVLGFSLGYGLTLRSWSFSHSLWVSAWSIIAILSPFFLLLFWRRGYFDLW